MRFYLISLFYAFENKQKKQMHRHYQAEFVEGGTIEKTYSECYRKSSNRKGANKCLSKKCAQHRLRISCYFISCYFQTVGFYFGEMDTLVALNLWNISRQNLRMYRRSALLLFFLDLYILANGVLGL